MLQVTQAEEHLMAAITQRNNHNNQALIRAVAKICLNGGLSKEGATYVLKSVHCRDIEHQLHAEGVLYTGKLSKLLQTGAPGKYFIISGGVQPAFKPDLLALIPKQFRTRKVKTVLSNLRMGTRPTLLPMQLSPTIPNKSNSATEGNPSSSQSNASPPGSSQPSKHVRLVAMYEADVHHSDSW